MDALLSVTSLPNIHPGVVHFPIALLAAALAFDVAGLALRRPTWVDRTAAALFLLGALCAWAAVVTGERAADSLVNVPALVQPLVDEHHDWAERTAWFFSAVAVARLALLVSGRGARPWRLPARASLLAAALGGQWLLYGTADRGGALVYVHGLAVVRPEAAPLGAAEVPRTGASPETRCVRTADGRITWEPLPGDAAALGSVVDLMAGSAGLGVVADAEADASRGLGLEVSGRSILVLPDELGDVQVEASLDASAFRGTIGVVHHARTMHDAGAFELSTAGRAALVVEAAAGRKVLDEAAHSLSGVPCTVAVSAVGRHTKGIVDGAIVVHGHADPLARGQVGLLLDGAGVVRLHSLGASPLDRGKDGGSHDSSAGSRS
jgi:uncharacterized membrane protein